MPSETTRDPSGFLKAGPAAAYYESWDSMEGIPDASAFGPIPQRGGAEEAETAHPLHRALEWIGDRVPGVALAAGLAHLSGWLAAWLGTSVLGFATSPINGIPLAILFGIVICNTIGVPRVFHAGLRASMLYLLRTAIVLLGLRLSLGGAGSIGREALPVVVICVASALLLVPWLGRRSGLSGRLATLIAVGTSICGVSAIVATAPAIDAKENEVSYAVACVALFGVVAMLVYPLLVPFLFGGDFQAIGIFLGTAIHDTSQVTGAALAYQEVHAAPEVLNTATVTKIVRNLAMVAVIPLMAVLYHRGDHARKSIFKRWQQVMPLFVIGFLAMTLLRTWGDSSARPFGMLEPSAWRAFLQGADRVSLWMLGVVMAAIGLSTGLAQLKRLGLRPLAVGLAAALTVGLASLAILRLRLLMGL
jgi:uncharacterized integral membrane protein (TIGR00698 family)